MPYSSLLRRARQVTECIAAHASQLDQSGGFPREEFRWLQEAGLLTVPLTAERGGAGLGTDPATTPTLLQLLSIIGRGNLSVGRLYEGHVNALQLAHRFGTEEQQSRFAQDTRGGRLFAVWNTQAGDGIKLEPLPHGGARLHGSKTFCSGAGEVQRPLITGAWQDSSPQSGGWQMLIVPMEAAQVEIDRSFWQPLGMRASCSYKVDFSGVEVGPEWLVGASGDYYRQPAFSGGAIRFCAVQLGGAQALLAATLDYLRELKRTSDAFQQARVGLMVAKIESCEAVLERAARLWDSSPEAAQMVAYAALCRLVTEETCNEVLELSERSVGARGLLRPHPIERIGRDLTLYLKQPHLDEIPGRVGRYALEHPSPIDELWRSGTAEEEEMCQ